MQLFSTKSITKYSSARFKISAFSPDKTIYFEFFPPWMEDDRIKLIHF